MNPIIERLRNYMQVPAYLNARHLKVGLIIGACWGLLSTVVFITVGGFGSQNHPNYWLFKLFQDSADDLWFRIVFLPFVLLVLLLSAAHYSPLYAVFASAPFGAVIGLVIGILTSVVSYFARE